MWERELMGLYISAHPLDEYAHYFAEQTVPLISLTKENDDHRATVGGLISTLRTIVTKNGSKMAFIGLEDKTGNTEVIVFPNLFAQISEQLKQDMAIRVEGTVNARDRDGKLMNEVKVIAENIMIVTDQELRDYEPTGGGPLKTRAGGVTATRRRAFPQKKASPSVITTPSDENPAPVAAAAKQIFVHVKDADDHHALMEIKQTCSQYPGLDSIVLVLGDKKKTAIKLPFPVESNDQLVGQLEKLLGEDAVVVK